MVLLFVALCVRLSACKSGRMRDECSVAISLRSDVRVSDWGVRVENTKGGLQVSVREIDTAAHLAEASHLFRVFETH